MKKLSENNKIEVVSEAFKVALGSVALAALLYYIDISTGFLKTLDINRDDVVMIGAAAVGFCFLWIVLDKWLFTPYVKLFERREKLTTGADEDIKHREEEIAVMLEQYEVKTLEARAASMKEKSEALQKAKSDSNSKIDRAKTVAQEELAKSKQEIASRKTQLESSAQKEAESLAVDMVNKVLASKGA